MLLTTAFPQKGFCDEASLAPEAVDFPSSDGAPNSLVKVHWLVVSVWHTEEADPVTCHRETQNIGRAS
eukprot:3621655-Rhodomonas_salina.1